MNFMDAVVNMVNGKRIVRNNWGGTYLIILPGQDFIWMINNSAALNINASIFTPSIDDYMATDYSVKTT